jgi:hypothetical protein
VAIEEALHDPDKMGDGEVPIWPIIDPMKEKDTDDKQGLHILELVQFANADWTAKANHGLRKDLEDKALLFPRFDNLTLAFALEHEGKNVLNDDFTPLYDSLSECILEIEELKNELTTIVMTQTSNGPNARDRWDTPEKKLTGNRKGKMRKDRYSSLIIANMIARQISRATGAVDFGCIGANAANVVTNKKDSNDLYKGPDWYTRNVNQANIFQGIYRK